MLQQTSAGQVLNVYGDFVQKYPTPKSILDTPQEELADDIESLGLRKRTRYFREASEQLVENHNSSVPNTREELLELQGVGEYTATSVLAHAFEKDVAAVDTNVARILSRVFGLDCGNKPEVSENWELAEDLLPPGRSSDYIHALIDFGAEVCTASNPDCESCPLEGICEYTLEESP
jgi:A/G-specific adenine glycosylase